MPGATNLDDPSGRRHEAPERMCTSAILSFSGVVGFVPSPTLQAPEPPRPIGDPAGREARERMWRPALGVVGCFP